MKLFFSPLTCSLASRITCYEAGLDVTFVEVDLKRKLTEDGRDFTQLSPLGVVPALELDEGDLLLENAAVLQFLARLRPELGLVPERSEASGRLQQWLSLIGTELHKGVFSVLFASSAPEGAKAYALSKAALPLSWLARQLNEREFLLDRFSVADAYLFTVLNWSRVTPVPLDAYPALVSYQARVGARPAVARAFSEEFALYRRKAAAAGEQPGASAVEARS